MRVITVVGSECGSFKLFVDGVEIVDTGDMKEQTANTPFKNSKLVLGVSCQVSLSVSNPPASNLFVSNTLLCIRKL